MVSVIAPIVTPGHPYGPLGASPLLVWQVLAAALWASAPLDYLSAVYDATALCATHLHLAIFTRGPVENERGSPDRL
jgi:hypothetical protein